MGKKNSNVNTVENVASGSKPSKAIWTAPLVDIFCDLCIKEVELKNRPSTHFNKLGWTNLIRNFAKETGMQYERGQLKNKWDALKIDWKLWKDLIGKETGLGWNSSRNTIDASDEWWENKIQVSSKYARFRSEGISPEMEDKLNRMFSNTIAIGVHAWAPSSGALPVESEEEDVIPLDVSCDSNDSIQTPNPRTKKGNQEKGKKRVATRGDAHDNKGKKGKVGGAAKLSAQIDRLVEVVESRSTATSIKNRVTQGSSIGEVMEIVETLPEGEPGSNLWWFATELFCAQEKREMFVHIKDANLKLEFLNKHKIGALK